MASNSQKSRLVYIEPNDLSVNGNALDNVTWNPEDLNIGVDLQVIIPDRNYVGTLSDNKNYQFSGRQKDNVSGNYISFFGGTSINGANYLTDNYINASYIEIKNGECGSSECIGVKDINISFSSYFYPEVTMTFVDVRGMSAIATAEEEYVNGLKNNERLYTNLYRALFRYPYPRFLLSIKGFFGTRVTFDLSVNDVKASLNGGTGNFDITVRFIGYMYGLYTDIPMNMLLISPYMDSDKEAIGDYWKNNANFKLTNGKQLPTLIEFVDTFARVAEYISNDRKNSTNKVKINEYTKVKNEIDALSGLKSCIDEYYGSLTDSSDVICITGDEYFIFASNSENLFVPLNLYNAAINKNADVVSQYGSQYDFGDCIASPNEGKIVLTKNSIVDSNGDVNPQVADYNIISGDTKLIENIINSGKLLINKNYVKLKHDGYGRKITTKINELNNKLTVLAEEASSEIKQIISDKLGFEPTLRNIFRMIFAHIDTFMHFMYNGTLNAIIKQQNAGERVTINALSSKGNTTDVESKGHKNIEVPPFPGVYKITGNEKTMVYPYEFPTMPEVNLVEKMTSAALSFRKSINSISDYVEQRRVFTENSNSEERFKMSFLPTSLNDISFSGTNPYSFLVHKGDDINAMGELLYTYVLRYIASAYSINADLNIPLIEACNYKLFKSRISQDFNNVFIKKGNDIEYLKLLLTKYIESHKDQLIANIEFRGDGIYLADKQNIPLHFKSVYANDREYGNIELAPTNYDKDTDISSVFNIMGKDEKKRISEFCNGNDILTKVLKYWGDNDKITLISNNVKTPDGTEYFETHYADHSEQKRGLYKYIDESIKIKLGEHDNSDGEYSEMVRDYYNTKDYAHYRMPFIGFNSKNNFFASPYIKKTQKNDYARGLILLSCFPFTVTYMNNVIDNIIGDSANKNVNDGEIVSLPKYIVLYIGGLLYREEYINANKKDIITGYADGFTLKNGYDIRKGRNFNINNNNNKSYISKYLQKLSGIEDAKKEILINTFKAWVETEFMPIFNRSVGEKIKFNKDEQGYWRCEDMHIQRMLMDLYVDEMYVFRDANNSELANIPYSKLGEFVSALSTMYSVKDMDGTNDDGSFISNDISNEMKLSCYRTLKNLYDRWLPSYNMDFFRLPSCSEEETIKKNRLLGNNGYHGGKNDKNEFCKFLFVDCYFNDIGDEFLVNPKILYDMVISSANSDTNYSVYQFMADLLQKNKMILMALPVFNNYYNIDSIRDIFTPHQQYSPKHRLSAGLGSIYVGMYSYDMSRNLNYGYDSSKCFDNDGFDLADTLGNVGQIGNGNSLRLFEYKNGKMNLNVPAFGVTFARQNQSYFKQIKIESSDARATDYGIFNTLELAKLGGKGFTDEPFAVGQDVFSIYSNRSYTCTVEMMGCANIMPMMYFQLNNIPMFKGAYMIIKVSHNIVAGNMTTSFTGVRINRNQLPFNKDIFNINSFVALINEFSAN